MDMNRDKEEKLCYVGSDINEQENGGNMSIRHINPIRLLFARLLCAPV